MYLGFREAHYKYAKSITATTILTPPNARLARQSTIRTHDHHLLESNYRPILNLVLTVAPQKNRLGPFGP